MHPLPPHTVHLVLQYICPLTSSLPPHLISTPLQQRHHFLQISPSTPDEYLCWPSSENTKVIELLDRLHPSSDQTSYPTRYTSDPESIFAHVQISSGPEGLRMLFHWDGTDGWKYHDLKLMPFPHPSLLIPPQSPTDNFTSGERLPCLDAAETVNNSDDDSYWNSYGAAGNEDDSSSHFSLQNQSMPDEDAYWAQYASVQGSADSTVPSPLPANHKLRTVNQNADKSTLPPQPRDDPIIDVPVDAIHSHPLTSRIGPPSPNTLTHLLSTISPRKDTHSPDLDNPYPVYSPSAYSLDPSSQQTAADSELVTPPMPTTYLDVSVVSSDAVKVHDVPPSKRSPAFPNDAEDKALTDSIKGLYYLWRAGRKGEPGEKDRNGFLQIVEQAITYG